MADGGGGYLIVGLVVGYFIWGNEPNYIDNVKANEESGASYVLVKRSSWEFDQVAVIHGLIDDAAGCETMRRAMQREGGRWACVPAMSAGGGKPWWNFW